jgi:hypothetical protein
VFLRDGVYYYLRRVPLDLAEHYSVKRLCFSLRTKSYKSALHASKSVTQRLEDYRGYAWDSGGMYVLYTQPVAQIRC